MGIRTIGALCGLPESLLIAQFGVAGRELLALAQGRDDSPVVPERQAKSLGRETTFLVDIADHAVLERTLLALSDEAAERLRRHALLARGITLKLRDDTFQTITRALALAEPADTTEALYYVARDLFRQARPSRPIRLIGVTADSLIPAAERQLSLFAESDDDKQRKVATAIDAIRARFGENAVIRARLAEGEKK